MKKKRLGKEGPMVAAIGLGCMGMSGDRYGRADEAECKAVLFKALENEMMLDTADLYGWGHNEELIGKALKEWSGEAFIATKFGFVRKPASDKTYTSIIDGRPEYAKQALEASLKRLKLDSVDLYYLHRVDKNVPIEESVGAMSEMVKDGKVRYIGLSEVSPKSIEKAHSVHPISAVQTEYSLWDRDVEAGIIPACQKLGIAFVPYCPLGRGILTGTLKKEILNQEGDRRKEVVPRFEGENFTHNLKLTAKVAAIAAKKGVTPAQLSLAWLLSKGDDIIPIPGTKQLKYLLENIKAAEIKLSEEDIREIESVIPPEEVKGERYIPEIMKSVEK